MCSLPMMPCALQQSHAIIKPRSDSRQDGDFHNGTVVPVFIAAQRPKVTVIQACFLTLLQAYGGSLQLSVIAVKQ